MPKRKLCSCGRPSHCANGQCSACKAASNRRYRYGMTPEDHTELWERQGGKCRLCHNPATDIDHDHATDKVRGLLCHGCNTALGQFGDNAEGLRRAVQYLGGTCS